MGIEQNKPVVRNIEPVPIEQNGQRLIYLRDPLNYTEGTLSVTLPAYHIITMMNGERTVKEIREQFNKSYDAKVTLEEVEQLVITLGDNYFLHDEKFEKRKEKVVNEFNESAVRESVLAGKSYPEDGMELSRLMDTFFEGHEPPEKSPFGIVAPHIDLNVGGKAFGAAYSQLRNSKAETFVILGIGHALGDDFFACIDKDFKTPLGISPVDSEFLAALEADFGEPIFNEMFVHKTEHSAEFQALFLQKIFAGEEKPRKIVPILLAFPENIDGADHPKFNTARINRFIAALQKGIDRLGEKVCVIAGVDLSHVGKRFGETTGVPEELLRKIEKDDRDVIGFVADGKKGEFVELMKKINPTNHICGFPALYILMDLMNGRKGELLDYKQHVEGKNDSMVSFASMKFD